MAKTFLFSPLGGTDPISNGRDGSFLHICRIYQPDKVYLFLSGEICRYHEMDNRYLYCLDQLGGLLGHNFEHELIMEKELSEVQDYNYFYSRFRDIIRKIADEMEKGDVLYVNTSSGTPAMKSTLQVMAVVSEYRFIPLQVSTPKRGMNSHTEDREEYEPEIQWACNLDNESDSFENRCHQVECENLTFLLKTDMIKKFVLVYDYRAARIVADEIRKDLPDNVYGLISAAEARLQLDRSGVSKGLAGTPFSIIPVKSGDQRDIVEYLLALEIKMKKGEYADFVRGITPVTADLFELILKEKLGFDVNQYCTSGFKKRQWDFEKLQTEPQVWNVLSEKYDGEFDRKDISSDHLMYIMQALTEDSELLNPVRQLRDAEMDVRNVAAHEIVSVTERWVREKTKRGSNEGFTPQQIFRLLKKLYGYAGLPGGDEVWKSYDKMNELILSQMEA